MAKTFIQMGHTLTCVAPADGVISGLPLIIGSLFVVPETDALVGKNFEGVTKGVYEMPKTVANAPAAFAKAYWDPLTSEITTVATGMVLVGIFTEAAINGDVVCKVRMNGVGV